MPNFQKQPPTLFAFYFFRQFIFEAKLSNFGVTPLMTNVLISTGSILPRTHFVVFPKPCCVRFLVNFLKRKVELSFDLILLTMS